MLNVLRKVLLLMGLVLGMITLSVADIPRQINFQGQLTDPDGIPLNGSYTCVFNIYDQSSGGSLLLAETTNCLIVQDGLLNYYIGTNATLNLSFGTTYWIGVKMGTDNEMTPRTKIVSVGNAYKALNSDTSAYLLSAANIFSGTLDTARLAPVVPRKDASNTWYGNNSFTNPVALSYLQNVSGNPLSVSLDNSLNVKFPSGSYVAFGLDSDYNKEVYIGTGTPAGPRSGGAGYYTGMLSLLGPDTNAGTAPTTRMRLYHWGSAGIIDTDATGGSIVFWPYNHILLKSLTNVAALPIGVMEVKAVENKALIRKPGPLAAILWGEQSVSHPQASEV